jgi:hypothetical protein
MIRLAIDLGAVLCALLMVVRMLPHVTATALWFGTAAVALHAAWQWMPYFSPLRGPEAMSPDLAGAALGVGRPLMSSQAIRPLAAPSARLSKGR